MNLSIKALAFSLLTSARMTEGITDRPVVERSRKTCKALVLRGCGKRAMYQVGVLKALVENTETEETDYDVFAGVSSGSVNACTLAKHGKGEMVEAIADLEEFIRWNVPEQGYENWPVIGPLSLGFQKGITNF